MVKRKLIFMLFPLSWSVTSIVFRYSHFYTSQRRDYFLLPIVCYLKCPFLCLWNKGQRAVIFNFLFRTNSLIKLLTSEPMKFPITCTLRSVKIHTFTKFQQSRSNNLSTRGEDCIGIILDARVIPWGLRRSLYVLHTQYIIIIIIFHNNLIFLSKEIIKKLIWKKIILLFSLSNIFNFKSITQFLNYIPLVTI